MIGSVWAKVLRQGLFGLLCFVLISVDTVEISPSITLLTFFWLLTPTTTPESFLTIRVVSESGEYSLSSRSTGKQ